MGQTKCCCNCHADLFTRYRPNEVIVICDDCKDEPCETVLMEQREEGENAKT